MYAKQSQSPPTYTIYYETKGGNKLNITTSGKWKYTQRTAHLTLSTDTTSKLHILDHDCDTLGMDGTQVSVFEETNKVGLCCLLLFNK